MMMLFRKFINEILLDYTKVDTRIFYLQSYLIISSNSIDWGLGDQGDT